VPVTRRNLQMTVAYDGTDFRGFAESDGVRTVMGDLRRAVETVVRTRVELVGAGRTDAGVHAWGQVVSGDVPGDTDLGRLQRSVNRLCSPDIAVRDLVWAQPGFSARFSATGRTYRYSLWNDDVPNPLLARRAWHVVAPLDVAAMNEAAAQLVGVHDFSSFCRRPKQGEVSLVRHVRAAQWEGDAPELCFEITASSFCHQMVRSIVGTLVEVGAGTRAATSIGEVLAARERSVAGRVAPPVGLVLHAVDYSGVRWDA
jgi:tRNA pseudouridine38-40 synthase